MRRGDGAAGGRSVLFVCAERIARDPTVVRLLAGSFAPLDPVIVAASRDDRRSFAERVAAIDRLLDGCEVGAGHGYDAWMLMAAAAERAERSASLPRLLLFNPVLGASQNLNGSLLGFRAPRGRRVRAAFGLDPEEDGDAALMARAAYVFGDTDPHSALRDWRYLRGLGCAVHIVRGWHERNRTAVEAQMRDVIVEFVRDQVSGVRCQGAGGRGGGSLRSQSSSGRRAAPQLVGNLPR